MRTIRRAGSGSEPISRKRPSSSRPPFGGPPNTLVTIRDNELPPTPGSLQFGAPAYAAAESAGLVTITVTRAGGSLGEVSVDYATSGDSAAADEDFEDTPGTLVFPSGVN